MLSKSGTESGVEIEILKELFSEALQLILKPEDQRRTPHLNCFEQMAFMAETRKRAL